MTKRNPNTYDDEEYTNASAKLFEAVYGLWEAGAEIIDIHAEFAAAIQGVENG